MLFYSDGVTETEMRIIILIVGICIAIAIYLVVKSLGKPVVLPKEKPARRPVPARRPRDQRPPRQPKQQRPPAPPRGRPLAPDDDIEFLRSLNTRPPQNDS